MFNDRLTSSLRGEKANYFFNLNVNIQTIKNKKLGKKYPKMLTLANSDARLIDEFYFL